MLSKFQQIREIYKAAPMEGRIFYLLATGGFTFSLINAIINYSLNIGFVSVLAALLTAGVSLFFLLYAYQTKEFIKATFIAITILTCTAYPILWFSNAGINGSMPYFYLLNAFLIATLLRKRQLLSLLLLQALSFVGLSIVELAGFYPTTPYSSPTARVVDLSLSLLLISLFIMIIMRLIMRAYHGKITDLVKTQQQLKHLTVTDELSTLYNRRYVMENLEGLIKANQSHHYAVIMLDIDHFKQVNDQHGHQAGDQVLRVVSQLLQQHTRKGDILGRIGGEEFLLLLKDASPREAKQKAEALREQVAHHPWPIPELQVTLSGGVYKPLLGDALEIILEEVDAKLYEAKNQGRNFIAW